MKQFFCFLLLLCPYLTPAQGTYRKAINVGEVVPDIKFKNVFKTPNSFKLSDFKGKFVILDFWATWCANCIKSFRMLDSMQVNNKEKLSIILVNETASGDSREKITEFFSRYTMKHGLALQFAKAYNDSTAANLFPHKYIPHYVWINSEGVCIAITGADDVTPANIEAVFNNKQVQFAGLNLLNTFDSKKPLFVNGNAGDGGGVLYRSTLSKFIPGMPYSYKRDLTRPGEVTKITIINASLLALIKSAYRVVEKDNRIVLNHTMAAFLKQADSLGIDIRYCYELITPSISLQDAHKKMQEDLNRYFGITARFQNNPAPAYLLTVDSFKLKRFKTKGGSPQNRLYEKQNVLIQNMPLAVLAEHLDDLMDKKVLIAHFPDYNVDLKLPDWQRSDDTPTLLRKLESFGIKLIPTISSIEQFIISKY